MKEKTAPKKERVRALSNELAPSINKNYKRIADIYRAFGLVFILIFVIFSVFLFLRYREYITYDNLSYLVKDFQSVHISEDKEITEISYMKTETPVFSTFRDGVAVVSNTYTSLFDATGVEYCTRDESFSAPDAASSDKYFIAYDIGGYSYSVYNSLTRISRQTTDMAITDICIRDDGYYLLTTESEESKYVTELHNSTMRKEMSVYKDDYVFDAALSNATDVFCIASISESGGIPQCKISFYRFNDENNIADYIYEMETPLCTSYMPDSHFVLITDKSVRFFDDDGNVVQTVSVGDDIISYFDAGKYVILASRLNDIGDLYRVRVFDNSGNILYNDTLNARINSVTSGVGKEGILCYVLANDGVYRIGDPVVKYDADNGAVDVIDIAGGTLICYDEKAVRIQQEKEDSDGDNP